MAGEIDGVLCLVYSGLSAAPTAILGQGNMSVEHVGDPIPISNKSSGSWQDFLDGGTTEQGRNVTIEFDYNSDTEFQTLYAAAKAKTKGSYFFDLTGTTEGFEGQFIPNVTSETANKNEIRKVSISFTSAGVVTDV